MSVLALVVSALSLHLRTPAGSALSRRAALAAAPFALYSLSPAAHASVAACKSGANNCLSSAGKTNVGSLPVWKFPAGASKAEVVASLRSVLEAYPQEGQAGVDLGGWAFADDQLASTGYARLEFKSGIGNFAKFFNGGKPFIDDFEVSIGDESVAVRSSSRIGDSDLGVNTKRVNYIAAALRAKGWDAPGVM
eukprot:scaffold247346_cov28-Tisochrysis_lutea.AAC.1